MRGIFYCSEDVFLLERRIVRKDFLERCTCGKKLEDVGYPDPEAPNARSSSAFPVFRRDSL